jgi:hypothetical protein
MSKKSKNISIGLILIMMAVLGISYAQNGGTGGTNPITKVSKTLSLPQALQDKITVTVTNMQATDIVNIRPIRENKINAKVASVTEQDFEMQPGKMVKLPKSGEPVSESALSISNDAITFARPQISSKIALDIEVPDSAQVEIFYNGVRVVKETTVLSPIAIYQNMTVGKGVENTAKVISRLMFPELVNREPNQIVEGADGSLMVPFSMLQLKKSNELTGTSKVQAIIEINEQGLVENVTVMEPLNSDASDNIAEQIRLWEFVPYKKNGTAVKVSTLFFK